MLILYYEARNTVLHSLQVEAEEARIAAENRDFDDAETSVAGKKGRVSSRARVVNEPSSPAVRGGARKPHTSYQEFSDDEEAGYAGYDGERDREFDAPQAASAANPAGKAPASRSSKSSSVARRRDPPTAAASFSVIPHRTMVDGPSQAKAAARSGIGAAAVAAAAAAVQRGDGYGQEDDDGEMAALPAAASTMEKVRQSALAAMMLPPANRPRGVSSSVSRRR